MKIGLEQKKRDRAAMYIKGRFEFRNKKAFTDDLFVRGGTGRQNLKVIKRSSTTGIIKMLEDTSQLRACSYGKKFSRLARKHFDKFTSEISSSYENSMKSYLAFI